MTASKPVVLTKKTAIRSSDADFQGCVSAAALVQLLTDAGWSHVRHWQSGFGHLNAVQLTWVNTSFRLQLDNPIYWGQPGQEGERRGGECLRIQTWLAAKDRFYWLRDFRLCDISGNEFGRATSSSILLNIETRRPYLKDDIVPYDASLSQDLPRVFAAAAGPAAPERLLGRNSRAAGRNWQLLRQLRVQLSDLDANCHVSNACYLAWLLDTYDMEFCRKHHLADFKLQYIKEALYGQDLLAYRHREESEPLQHYFCLCNPQNEELLRAWFHWRRRANEGSAD